MVAMYPHCTFNLNPRASSIDTPLHAFMLRKARRSHAPERRHRHRRLRERRKADEGNLRRRSDLHALAAARVRPGIDPARRVPPASAGEGSHPRAARPYQLGRRRQGMLRIEPAPDRTRRRLHRPKRDKGKSTRSAARVTGGSTRPRATETLSRLLPWLRGQLARATGKRQIATRRVRRADSALRQQPRRPAPGRTRHELPGPFPAHQDQAALRRMGPAHGQRRQPARATDGVALERYRADYAAILRESTNIADSPALRDPNPTVMLIPGLGDDRPGAKTNRSRA